MPSSDLSLYYRRALLNAWIRAILDHAFAYFQPDAREFFVYEQLAIIAQDFEVVFIWHGEEVVRIEEIGSSWN